MSHVVLVLVKKGAQKKLSCKSSNNNNSAEAGAEEEVVMVTPVLDTGELSPGSGTSLLLRPEDNSPFSSWARRDKSTSSDNLSNLYSQISGISTYEDYEGG